MNLKSHQMKKITLERFKILSLFLFASMLINSSVFAQCGTLSGPNLVPNPGFELSTSQCGVSDELWTDKTPCKDWYGLAKSNCSVCPTPQYVKDSCSTSNQMVQCTASSGKAAMGGYTVGATKDYFQAKLTQPLVAGRQYCFTMKVRGQISFPSTSDGLGAWFHDKGMIDIKTMNNDKNYIGPGSIINATPQIENPKGNMLGGNTCKAVTGTFCAKGGEQWIVIGNFRTDANTTASGGVAVGFLLVDELSLKENNALTITSIATTADSICPGSCATLTANPSGGSGTYTYKWSPGGETTKSISACPTVDGTFFKCTVSSSMGCTTASTTADSVKVNFKKYIPSPTIATSTSSTICSGDTLTLTCTPAQPNYKWSTGETTQSIKVTAAGPYTVTVKHPYSGCNTTSAATNVVVNTLPVLNLSGLKSDSTACDKPTGSITGVTATGAPTLTYLWTPTNQTTADLLNVSKGNYTLTVTDGNGCKKSTTATIYDKPSPPAPGIELSSATTTVCTENDIKLAISSPDPTFVYTWYQKQNPPPDIVRGTGPNLLLPNAQLSDAGTYYVTATKFGCAGSASSIDVTVNQTPDTVVVKAVAGTVCEGTQAILYVNPPADPNYTYTWKSPDSNTPDVVNDSLIIPKVQLKDAGMYSLITTSKLGCPSHDAHVKLMVDSAAKSSKISLSNAFVCEGDTVTITPATPTPGISYKIYVKSSKGTDSLVGIAPLKVVPHVNTKYYMDAVTTKGCSQASEKDTATVTVYTAPVVPIVTASDSIICDNDSTTIFVFNPVSGVTYKVYDSLTGGTGHDSPYKVILHQTTTFYVEAISTKSCIQITGRRPITIKVNPLPDRPNISVESKPDNKLCSGETAKLISSINNNITWLPDSLHTPSITVNKGGLYTLYFTDPNGCRSAKDSTFIKLVEPPKLDVSNYGIDTVRCNATIGGIHGININSGTGPYTYAWYNINDLNTPVSTDLTLKGVPTGKYTLIVTDKNGCTDVLSSVLIPTRGGIVAHLTGNPTTGVAPLDVLATTTITGVGKPVDYVWYLDGRLMGTTDDVTNTFSFDKLPFGNHVIQVNVRDTNKCKSVDYLTITVLTSSIIHDVNIFTPNNDGHNDILIFPTEGIQSLQGTIYDRWGLKIFEWSDAENGWDGNDQSGKAVPEGTYYYILKGLNVDGTTQSKAGYIELIRK